MISAKFRLVRWLCGGMLIGVATICTAQTPLRKLPLVRITPDMLQQATQAPPTPKQPSYLTGMQYPPHDILPNNSHNLRHIPNGCSHNQASLCFDYRTGHAVYKPMRKLLPDIPGMSPHNLSIRRDKILAEYSFK